MTQQSIRRAVKRAVASGNWMIRADRAGESYNGFRWPEVGVWVKAPDWDPRPECGKGLHGQGPDASGSLCINGPKDKPVRLVFCETRGQRVIIKGDKLKVPEARILLVNDLRLAKGLTVGGALDLRDCPISSLPEGLTVGGYLDLRGCPITSLPEGLTVGGYLNLRGCPISEGLTVGGYLNLRGCPLQLIRQAKERGFRIYD